MDQIRSMWSVFQWYDIQIRIIRIKRELIFELEMTILELYDLNDSIVPRYKWVNHYIDIDD